MKNINRVFITGSCGFIGFHLSLYFLSKGYKVYSIDNLNDYYSVKLKKKRLNILKRKKNFFFKKISLNNNKSLIKFIKHSKSELIIHLAAQPGVRYSFVNPNIYLKYNTEGFLEILKAMEKTSIKSLIFASSSSVYGDAKHFPTNETNTLNPINLYAATKVFNEEMAKIYFKNSKINSFGLRFFTSYGSLGRPDMLIDKTIQAIKNNKKINLYNNGNHSRDFTHVNDVTKIIFSLSKKIKKFKGYEFFNICSGKKISIKKILREMERLTGKKIKLNKVQKQKGDMLKTHGSNKKIINFLGKKIRFLKIKEGLKETLFKKYE